MTSRNRTRSVTLAFVLTALVALAGCGDDFTPAPGDSKAGPFEVLGEPVAAFDGLDLVVRFDAVNRSGDDQPASSFNVAGHYSDGGRIEWGANVCYGSDSSSTLTGRRGTMVAPGEEVHMECVYQSALAYHAQGDFDLAEKVTVTYTD